MNVRACMHVGTHAYKHPCVRMCTRTHTHMGTCTSMCMNRYVYVDVCMCGHMHTWAYTRVCVCACMRACVCTASHAVEYLQPQSAPPRSRCCATHTPQQHLHASIQAGMWVWMPGYHVGMDALISCADGCLDIMWVWMPGCHVRMDAWIAPAAGEQHIDGGLVQVDGNEVAEQFVHHL